MFILGVLIFGGLVAAQLTAHFAQSSFDEFRGLPQLHEG